MEVSKNVNVEILYVQHASEGKKCLCSCVSHGVANMYRNIVTGPSTSFVVCNQCDQIVTKVICLMFLC